MFTWWLIHPFTVHIIFCHDHYRDWKANQICACCLLSCAGIYTCPALLVHDSLDRNVHNITARNIRTFAAFARIWTCQQLPHYTPHWPKELQYPLAWDRVRLWKDADCMGAAAKAASPQATRFLDPVLRTMNYVPLSWGFHQMRRCYKTPQLVPCPDCQWSH